MVVAGILKALEIGIRQPELRTRLWENAEYFHTQLRGLGLDTGASTTYVMPIVIGERERMYRMGHELRSRGLWVAPVDYPAVPLSRVCFRACVTAKTQTERTWMKRSIFLRTHWCRECCRALRASSGREDRIAGRDGRGDLQGPEVEGRAGRIIDSVFDYLVFLRIYVHLRLRCLFGGASLPARALLAVAFVATRIPLARAAPAALSLLRDSAGSLKAASTLHV